jgi:hypothetical protein
VTCHVIPAPSEIFQVTSKVAAAFDVAGIRYFLGGSVASALYGEARSTRDIDFVAAMFPPQVGPFVAALGNQFYAKPQAIADAVASRRSFNVIHLDTMVKADSSYSKLTHLAAANSRAESASSSAQAMHP